ncbi:MAG: hypothetical protein DRI34_04380 [Deltaproteobacteria bacterium]|nr:MAG: hypothetical protein DRI34_04380 [Deltaproteobacteria bacterium]
MTRMIAFYGKGGIGKSTVASNLGVLFASRGNKVLLFGCDPKSDSCHSLVPGLVTTVMEKWQELGEADLRLTHCLMNGRQGVDCLEVGGPVPGTGCGGRGITKAFELVGQPDALEERYDVVLFDVLGDVVCGGFSAPLRAGYAREVYIVTSGEPRSLYAANNICQAVVKNAVNGARLGGLVANLRGGEKELPRIERFAHLVGVSVVHAIPRDEAVVEAEIARRPVVEWKKSSAAARAIEELSRRLEEVSYSSLPVPRPLLRDEFDEFLAAERG